MTAHMNRIVSTLAVVGWILTGCGAGASKSHSQVVARVNDQNVTVMQLNQVLQSSGMDSATPEIVRAAIDSLVDEELLVQEALKNQIDRDPTVVQQIDQARRRVLAQTYAQRKVYPKTPVSLVEEEQYYRSHGPLFEHRRMYRMTAFTIQNSDLTAGLSSELNNIHSVDDVRTALEHHEIKYETQQMNSAAEDLPLDKLDQFAKAAVGDLLIAGQSDGTTSLLSVVSIEERPLSFEHARPVIERYLTAVRNKEAATAYLKRVREASKISVSARYSAGTPSSAATPGVEAPGETKLSDARAQPVGRAELN